MDILEPEDYIPNKIEPKRRKYGKKRRNTFLTSTRGWIWEDCDEYGWHFDIRYNKWFHWPTMDSSEEPIYSDYYKREFDRKRIQSAYISPHYDNRVFDFSYWLPKYKRNRRQNSRKNWEDEWDI